jgi:hypothetical protein
MGGLFAILQTHWIAFFCVWDAGLGAHYLVLFSGYPLFLIWQLGSFPLQNPLFASASSLGQLSTLDPFQPPLMVAAWCGNPGSPPYLTANPGSFF